ncbi:MAG TPA: carotenoid oxygenase [Halieaceae bacterium]|nr:carotenoid oxygenase [Halieaceae bacterium]
MSAAAGPDWALGWRTVRTDTLPPLAMAVTGDWPRGLKGTLLRNGPARYERGGRRYRHWFDGDGMLQQFRIGAGAVTHYGRFIETEKYRAERNAGRFLYDGAGTHFEGAEPGRNNDTINVANTALLPFEDEVLALWEGGSAYRVAPGDLDTLGPKRWGEGLAHMPFSAHPLPERDGSYWNFGFAPYAGAGGTLVIYRFRPGAGMESVTPLALPFPGYLHDFAQTDRQLLFLLPPYRYDAAAGATFVDRFRWEPQAGSRLLVIDKDDLTRRREFELPAGFVFHFGHAARRGTELRLQLCWYDSPALMASGMKDLVARGQTASPIHARASTIVADLRSGAASLQASDTVLEFPGFDERADPAGAPVYGAGKAAVHSERPVDTVAAWRPQTGAVDEYRYPYGVQAEEPLFVAAGDGGPGQGWLLQTYLDCNEGFTGLNVFDAGAIAAGPLATATMARALPLGFHGTFLPA